jgi:hypothetical protein
VNGAGIQVLRVAFFGLNGDWAKQKRKEAFLHSSRVKLKGLENGHSQISNTTNQTCTKI